MTSSKNSLIASVGQIARTIVVLRGQRVLLDSELAALYGATTKRLDEQVKRNAKRFPDDSCFASPGPKLKR